MNAKTKALVDPRQAAQILRELQTIRPGFVPEWLPASKSMDEALLRIFVRYIETMLQRLNQAPDKNFMAFLETLGVRRLPARSARAPIVFQVAELAEDGRIPQGTKLGAAPPPGQGDQIIFETEKAVGLASAKLVQVVSLNPGRDEFKDHTEALLKGKPFTVFSDMQLTEHVLYLAHQRLLALVGKTSLRVFFDLQTGSDERLDLTWEYWDGKVWRTFRNVLEQCDQSADQDLDSTDGLTRSGRFVLETDCAETQKTIINDIESYWIRARLLEPLPVDPAQALPLVDTIKMQTVVSRKIVRALSEDITAELILVMDYPNARTTLIFKLTGKNVGPIEGATIRWSLRNEEGGIPEEYPDHEDLETKKIGLTEQRLLPKVPVLEKQPDIVVAPSFHDYGEITRGKLTPVQPFEVKNEGEGDLRLNEIILFDGNKDDFLIESGSGTVSIILAPNQTHKIEVSFKPKDLGLKQTVLRVKSNDPDEPVLNIRLLGTGIAPFLPDIFVHPSALDFGDVALGNSALTRFVVRNDGNADLQVNSTVIMGRDENQFKIINGGSFNLKLNETKVLDVNLSPTTAGVKEAKLRIDSNDPDEARLEISLSGAGLPVSKPDLKVHSLLMDFGDVIVGATSATRSFTFNNAGKADLVVSSVTVNSGEFVIVNPTPPPPLPLGGLHSLDIFFKPTALGLKHARLRIASNDPDEPALEIEVRGNAVAPMIPDIFVSPPAHDFGAVGLTMSKTRSFVVRNDGNDDLQVNSTIIMGRDENQFKITNGGSFNLKLNETKVLDVNFSPTTAGVKEAKLQLDSNDRDRNPVEISLGGEGVPAPKPDLVVDPVVHDFSQQHPPVTKAFVVTNLGQALVKVMPPKLEGTNVTEFTIEQESQGGFNLEPGQSRDIFVSFTSAQGSLGEKTAKLILEENNGAGVVEVKAKSKAKVQAIKQESIRLEIPLRGIATLAPSTLMTVAPVLNDFGALSVGDKSKPVEFTLTNGTVPIRSGMITVRTLANQATNEFVVENSSLPALGNGDTHKFKVSFTPNTAGVNNAKLFVEAIQDTGGDGTPIDLDIAVLFGRGVTKLEPQIAVIPTSHDFGAVEVGTGAPSRKTFVIRNDGYGELMVTGVKLEGTNKTDFKIEKDATGSTIQPGKTDTIIISCSPGSVSGKSAELQITSNDPDQNRKLLPIPLSAFGVTKLPPDITVEPFVLDFGEVEKTPSTPIIKSFMVKNLGGVDLQVKKSSWKGDNAGEFAIAEGDAPFTVSNATPHEIKIQFIPKALGKKRVILELESDDRNEPNLDLALTASVVLERVPKIFVSPPQHDFVAIPRGTTASRDFIVMNAGGAILRVKETVLSGTGVANFMLVNGGPFDLSPDSSRTITIKFTPSERGVREAVLRLASEDSTFVDIRLAGTGVSDPVPDITVEPLLKDFGEVEINKDSELVSFKIRNDGEVNLNVSATNIVDENSADFSLVSGGGGFVVRSKDERMIVLKFRPTSVGSKRASLEISSDDPDEPKVEVVLIGKATPLLIPILEIIPITGSFPPQENFGPIVETRKTSRVVVIANSGGKNLDVKAMQLLGDDPTEFKLEAVQVPFTLEPGRAKTITISFAPTAPGEKNAILRIESNDPPRNPFDIPLRGESLRINQRTWKINFSVLFPVKEEFFDFLQEVVFDPVTIEEKIGKKGTFSIQQTKFTEGVKNFTADQGFANAEELDLTAAFYPYGLFVLPGSTFYFSSEEVFSKPGARTTIRLTVVPNPNVATGAGITVIEHKVIWEYWNGQEWAELSPKFEALDDPENVEKNKEVKALNNNGTISFAVPPDMNKTTVNDKEAFWVRVRVLTGGFGITRDVAYEVRPDPAQQPVINRMKIAEPNPPAISEFALGYIYESPKEFFDHCLALNDFRHLNHSIAARTSGQFFLPFQRLSDNRPALYIGFDKKLPVDFLQIFFNLEELDRDDENPELLWEYWDGAQWRETLVEDETGHLQRPGMVSFIGQNEAQFLDRFGTSRHWLRARLREDGPTEPSRVLGLFHNAVWASQRQRIQNEIIGESNGRNNQFFRLRQFPVLDGELVEVRELAEPLAHVEYPILKEKFGDDNLRVVRNAEGRVTEVWVRWQYQPHFFFSGPEDRHYTLDRAGGRIFFGDDEHGKTPPPNAAIMAREYTTGGGTIGNVRENAVAQLLGGVPGVQAVFNPLPAEGGAEGELPERILSRGPLSLRHRERALTVRDYEIMAREASSEVAWVRVFQNTDASFARKAGHVTVMILPESLAPRPQPSFGLRQRVKEHIEQRGPATMIPGAGVHVTGPEYFEIGVEVTVVPINFSEAGFVVERVRKALEEFLHPLRGGPQNMGWELGRDVFLSDVAARIEKTPGVDFVETLHLLRDGAPQGERVAVPEQRLVVAGEINIKAKIVK